MGNCIEIMIEAGRSLRVLQRGNDGTATRWNAEQDG
jgi:hypothetical protein